MEKDAYCRNKKCKPRKNRVLRFGKTVSVLFGYTLLIVIACGLFGRPGIFNDRLIYQHNAENSSETPWNLILVNKSHPIPEDYAVNLIQLSNGKFVDARIFPELQEMLDAAEGEGVYPVVVAGYRTAQK